MDNTLELIIKTDRNSREKLKESKQRLISIDEEISEAKNSIDEELFAQSQKSIAKATETAEINLKNEIARIDNFYSDAEANLRSYFDEKREDIANKIFENIIK